MASRYKQYLGHLDNIASVVFTPLHSLNKTKPPSTPTGPVEFRQLLQINLTG